MAASGDCYCALHIAADGTFRKVHQKVRVCAEMQKQRFAGQMLGSGDRAHRAVPVTHC